MGMMKMTRGMNNQELARLLWAISAAYEIKGENRFKVVAYERAATAIEHATSEVKDLWDDNKLTSLPGIGPSIAQHLDELFQKGSVGHFERIFSGLPPAMFELLDIAGIGAKTAYKLCRELKIRDPRKALDKIERAAEEGKIAPLKDFGEKSQADILEAIQEFKKGQRKKKRMSLAQADVIAQEIISYLEKSPSVVKADPLGSLRRRVATVGDIDVAVATEDSVRVIDRFLQYPQKKKTIERGPSGASILLKSGYQVDLRVQKPETYGSMLQYFTGSKHHNIHLRELALKKGLSLSEHGIKERIEKPAGRDSSGMGKWKMENFTKEEDFYHFLGLPWISPELREDAGEIEAAQGGKLPKLVKNSDIRGDLHTHSSFSIEESHDPGTDPMEEMLKQAEGLGWEYLGFSEHNPSLSKHSGQQVIDLIKRKKEKIEQIKSSRTKKLLKGVFNGLEIDIRPNGELALPEKALELLDYGIASVHSSFRMSRKQMTGRVLRALDHPKIRILGHPTGRKLGQREGYELDWEQIFAFCRKHQKWLEINAYPDRLDLPDVLVREAVKNKVKIIINTDAHAVEHLKLMSYGVSVARRGWAEKKDIINTLSYDRIKEILKVKSA